MYNRLNPADLQNNILNINLAKARPAARADHACFGKEIA